MKKFMAALVLFSGMNVFAADNLVDANLFTCTGASGTDATFTTSSLRGLPTLGIKYRGEQVTADNGGKVTVQETLVGTLATITDSHLVPVDGPTVRYTMIVPHVKVEGMGATEEFSTVAIRTSVGNPFFGPRGGNKVVENNATIALDCQAQAVVF